MSRLTPKLHPRAKERQTTKGGRTATPARNLAENLSTAPHRLAVWKIVLPSLVTPTPLGLPALPCPALAAIPAQQPNPVQVSLSTFAVCPFVSRTILCNGSHFTAKRLFLLLLLNDATLFHSVSPSFSAKNIIFECQKGDG